MVGKRGWTIPGTFIFDPQGRLPASHLLWILLFFLFFLLFWEGVGRMTLGIPVRFVRSPNLPKVSTSILLIPLWLVEVAPAGAKFLGFTSPLWEAESQHNVNKLCQKDRIGWIGRDKEEWNKIIWERIGQPNSPITRARMGQG